jgi:acyl-CoA dehydrogenase
MVSGEAVGAIAMTEPGAGSDLQDMRTSAVKDGEDYILNGSKTFITNGQHANMVIVAAKTDPKAGARGISLFLVDTSLPGYGKGRNLDKIGQHSGDTSEMFFSDMRLPASALLGEEGQGFMYLMRELPRERLVIGALGVAAARGALDLTITYAGERELFGQKLAQLQNTRFEIARMETDCRVNRAFVDECIALYEKGELDAPQRRWPSTAPRKCSAGSPTVACSCSAATDTPASTRFRERLSTPGCKEFMAARRK